MENFIFQNPTKLIFGKGMIGQLAKEIPAGKRILVTFGGGSVRKNGVYDQVKEALKGFEVTEFWGIEANPKIETTETARQSERGIVDMDTLKATNESLISTLDEVMAIQREGREKRQAAEAELRNMEQELKGKLLQLHG